MVHFEDLRLTFDRMDWYLYSYSYYKLFGLFGYETQYAFH